MEIDGARWRADPPLDDGNGNPPRGWENPEQRGSLRPLSETEAEFVTPIGLRARFVRDDEPARAPFVCD